MKPNPIRPSRPLVIKLQLDPYAEAEHLERLKVLETLGLARVWQEGDGEPDALVIGEDALRHGFELPRHLYPAESPAGGNVWVFIGSTVQKRYRPVMVDGVSDLPRVRYVTRMKSLDPLTAYVDLIMVHNQNLAFESHRFCHYDRLSFKKCQERNRYAAHVSDAIENERAPEWVEQLA